MRNKSLCFGFSLLGPVLFAALAQSASLPAAGGGPKVLTISAGGVVEASWDGQKASLRQGQRLGVWTLMAVIAAGPQRRFAVFEDFSQKQGRILFVDAKGVQADLPKSLEPTFAESSSLYHGHSLEEVMESDRDLLGEEILAKPGDPDYAEVAACFPPISKMRTYTFVGTHDSRDKIGFEYGGRTPQFNPAPFSPAIDKARERGTVMDGLVGGWLPVVRFVYPEENGDWTEMVSYAPQRIDNENPSIQPVWYRISRVENNELKWSRYFDSYPPFPPRMDYAAEPFYEQLLVMRDGWNRALDSGMKIEIPDQRLQDMARHSLVRDMITRIGSDARYGVFDRAYGGTEHAGFPDTFNADTATMLQWGLFRLAGDYIANYFGKYVRDDGSILYRGPETGQYGRMLTLVAEYATYTGDSKLLLSYRSRIDGVTKLLLGMREKALKLSPEDPAYGIIAGWSEADACLDPDPPRYMQPYLSNNAEAVRGFRDLGRVWERIGTQSNQPELVAWGRRLVKESEAMNKDLQTAISRSMLQGDPPVLPAIAGVKEPFHIAVARDPLDPQFRSYRAYMEMLYSGMLTREQVGTVVNYRAAHRDTILGVPTAYGYNTHELVGFLTYGHAYGLIQYDFVRQYLLTLYSIMAHQYTRGTWTAPETRNIDPPRFAAPYCTPAQMVVPLMARWMLVLEDPLSDTLWLAKGTPRSWLEDGKKISVADAPTRWGKIGFSVASQLKGGKITARVELPASSQRPAVKLRLRAPEGSKIRSVTLNGTAWKNFDPQEETVTIPAGAAPSISLVVDYQ